MNDIYIKNIKINKVRHLQNMEIEIANERKHLIITGKNGSGKTSLLEAIRTNLIAVQDNTLFKLQSLRNDINHFNITIKNLEQQIQNSNNEQERVRLRNDIIYNERWLERAKQKIKHLSQVELDIHNFEFLQTEYNNGNFIIAFFDAKRSTQLQTPDGIHKIQLKNVYEIDDKANQQFIQYLVNLKAKGSFARDANKLDIVKDIDKWFETFEHYLKEIFEDASLKLEFDSDNFNFNIVQDNKEKFNLNTLSDGYSAILNIITELILRMENHSPKIYDLQGIVLIDEVETHLHIELQKIILPFLIKVFPKIQFIVTTHSPFVINSIENSAIYDLEKQILVTDLSGISSEGVVEAYFNSDKYSVILKEYVKEYEQLYSKAELNEWEQDRVKELRTYFKNLPKFMAPELELKIQQIELSKLKLL